MNCAVGPFFVIFCPGFIHFLLAFVAAPLVIHQAIYRIFAAPRYPPLCEIQRFLRPSASRENERLVGRGDFAALGGNFGPNTGRYGCWQSFTKGLGSPRRMKLAAASRYSGFPGNRRHPHVWMIQRPTWLLRDFAAFFGFKRKIFPDSPTNSLASVSDDAPSCARSKSVTNAPCESIFPRWVSYIFSVCDSNAPADVG